MILFGVTAHKAPAVASSAFSPTDEFKLDTWFKLGPVALNKGVLYLLITAGITVGVMFYISRHLQQRRPGRVQVAVEVFTTSSWACPGKTSAATWSASTSR